MATDNGTTVLGQRIGQGSGAASGASPTTGTTSGNASSTGGGDLGSQTGSAQTSSQGCSAAKPPIVIGSVGTYSGLAGTPEVLGVRAVQAWVASVNATGGLKCHPVKYIVSDDGGDPSRHQSLVKTLVEEKHVVAFVQQDAVLTDESSVDYITSKRIPVIGSEGGGSWYYESPMYFPQMIHGFLLFKSMIAASAFAGKPKGKTAIAALSCVEASACSGLYDNAPKYAPEYGMNLVYRAKVSIAQPDYTSSCQAAQSANAQLLLVVLDSASLKRVARSCSSVNYHPIYISATPGISLDLATDSDLQGLVVAVTTIPWFTTSNGQVVRYQSVMKRYAPGLQLDAPSMAGWVSAAIFEKAALRATDPTGSDGVLQGLWSLKNDDLGGSTIPLTFRRNATAPQTFCYWLTEIKNGHFVSPNSSRSICK